MDLQSRRGYRSLIIWASLLVLLVFVLNLSGVVYTLACAFHKALEPQSVAKSVAVELAEKIGGVAAAASTPVGIASAAPSSGAKSSKASASKIVRAEEASKDVAQHPIRIDAKIFGEVRDSMVPMVALVSILTVAVVVILGTMLKAAFAPHPHHKLDKSQDKDDVSPVPLVEALKSLVESLKGFFKRD